MDMAENHIHFTANNEAQGQKKLKHQEHYVHKGKELLFFRRTAQSALNFAQRQLPAAAFHGAGGKLPEWLQPPAKRRQ